MTARARAESQLQIRLEGTLLTTLLVDAAVRHNSVRLSDAQVRAIQQKLGVVADGIMGPHTVEAIAGYQRQHGLEVDGKLSLGALQERLYARSWVQGALEEVFDAAFEPAAERATAAAKATAAIATARAYGATEHELAPIEAVVAALAYEPLSRQAWSDLLDTLPSDEAPWFVGIVPLGVTPGGAWVLWARHRASVAVGADRIDAETIWVVPAQAEPVTP